MQYTENHKAQALALLEIVTPKQWECILKIAGYMTEQPTEEDKRKEAERQAAEERKKAERAAKRIEDCKTFDSFRDKKLKGLKMPSRYDFSYDELTPIMPHIMRSSWELEPVLNGLSFMYDWGFKRGMNFAKAQAKATKKEQATI